jgi:phosphoserine phosphatase RsbU/P
MQTKPVNILVIDNSKEDRELLSSRLGQQGFNVVTAQSGDQALKIVETKAADGDQSPKFDLVLLDISKVGEDDYQLLQHLKNAPALSNIPIMVTATSDDVDSLLKCIDVGAQAAISLKEKASKMERDLEIGHQIQQDFLPKYLPQPPGWEIAAHFDPARDVAGDFYDVIGLPHGKLALVLGDVCDKGVGPALFMSLTRSLMRAFTEDSRTSYWLQEFFSNVPPTFNVSEQQRQMLFSVGTGALLAVELTNDYIALNHSDMNMFLTLFFGVLDPASGTLTYINAGHEAPFVITQSGNIKARLKATGPVLGVDALAEFKIEQVNLDLGDLVLIYSDGVPDARDPERTRFTQNQLLTLLQQPAPSAAALLERVKTKLWEHIGDADQYDDITMLAARRVPVHEQSLTIPGNLDSLDEVAGYVMKAATEAGLERKVIYRLRLAVDEIATNIVMHGYEEAGLSGDIEIHSRIDADALTIYLEDSGVGYDPHLDKIPEDIDKPIEERRIGGLGVYLAVQNVDKFLYERVGERNRHTFVVNRTPPDKGD